MQSNTFNLLIISNMGPKKTAPFQGNFVLQQVRALTECQPEYHYMRWHSDSRLNRLLKYPVFALDFIWRYIIRRKRFDILHVHFFYPTIWLALLYKYCRHRNVKIVVTCHGSDLYYYTPPSKWYRWCTGFVDHWIFASDPLRRFFYRPVSPVTVLTAGIADHFATATCYSAAQKTIDLLYVGSLEYNKGLDRFLAILPEWQDKKIVVAGAGPMQAELQAAAIQYPNLQLIGVQTTYQLQNLYQQARCYINLSRNESFGLVMAEAMACYTPVVATDTDGAKAQLIDGKRGFVVPQQSDEQQVIDALIAKVKGVWSLPEDEYNAMQLAGRQWAEGCLLSDVANALTDIYQQVST